MAIAILACNTHPYLHRLHMAETGFLMTWLKYNFVGPLEFEI